MVTEEEKKKKQFAKPNSPQFRAMYVQKRRRKRNEPEAEPK